MNKFPKWFVVIILLLILAGCVRVLLPTTLVWVIENQYRVLTNDHELIVGDMSVEMLKEKIKLNDVKVVSNEQQQTLDHLLVDISIFELLNNRLVIENLRLDHLSMEMSSNESQIIWIQL